MALSQAAAPGGTYVYGDCTYYVATRFPQIYGYLGNALDWITSAKKQGYQILSKPAPDTVVVYGAGNGYSSLGHVAVVDSVNSDGTFQVSEMNYTGWDVVDTRRSTMTGVIGFIVPPGSTYKSSSNPQTTGAISSFQTSIFGQDVNINLDPVVGGLAMAAGGVLMLFAVGILVAKTFADSRIGRTAAGVVERVTPAGAAVAAASAPSKTKQNESAAATPTPEQEASASKQRVATAKARAQQLSPSTERELSEARAGRGKRLSPTARKELGGEAA